jgi:hypothetical protein
MIKYITREIPVNVDTAAILSGYFTQRIFEDKTQLGDRLSLTIRDTLFENKILGRTISYDLRFPEITKTFLKKPDYSLSILADSRLNASVLLGYRQMYVHAGYDFGRKAPFAGVGLKLWER